MDKIIGVSLFSSAGIAETYFKELGIDIRVANELLPKRADLYRYFYPNTNMIQGDITEKNIFDKKECSSIFLKKDIVIEKETTNAKIQLTSAETKIGELITKPVDYWYEIVLNPDTAPQTIVGYLDNPTIFQLLPESGDSE